MFVPWTWSVDPTRILTRSELAAVLQSLGRQARRSDNARMNSAIVRLACCCGLRASEIAGLTLDDVVLVPGRPHVRIRAATAKRHKARRVPLWWDAGTLADLEAWKATRAAHGARGASPFVCGLYGSRRGQQLSRHAIRERFLTGCKALGLPRLRTLTIHHGRHTFVSHALAGGRTLAEVRDAAGHASVLTTSVYLHVCVTDSERGGSLFPTG